MLDFSRHLNRVRRDRPRGADRRRRARHRAGRPAGAAAPYGLRFGPDPSTHNRCTLGGMIGNNACGSRALGYGRTVGQRRRARRGHRHRRAATAVGRADATPRARRRTLDGAAARTVARRRQPGHDPHRVRPVRPAGLRLLAGAPAARARLRRAPAPVGTEGTLAVVLGATVRLVGRPPATALVALGYPDMASAADAVPALLPFLPDRGRGPGHAASSTSLRARRGPAAVPPCRAATAGCSWSWPARPRRGRSTRRRRSSPPRARWTPGGHRAGEAAALWRIREDGAGLASAAGRRARLLGLGGRRGAAGDARRLPARIRGADGRARRDGRAVRALRRRLRARPDRLPARADRRRRCSARSCWTPRSWSRPTAVRCPASTATAGPAASCCR